MIQYELERVIGEDGGPVTHTKRNSAMILDYQESPFDDLELQRVENWWERMAR